MGALLQDLRYGLRMLAKSPGFTAVAVLTLALGIGANTAIFSVVNGVLLNPLPYPSPNQLVTVDASKPLFPRGSISYPNFLDWHRMNHSFSGFAVARPTGYMLTGEGDAEELDAAVVTSDFFSLLGIRPVLGHGFTPDEDRIGVSNVVAISTGLWRRKFGASPDVIGKSISLDGKGYIVVGVFPGHLDLPMRYFGTVDVYAPLGQFPNKALSIRQAGLGIHGIARLRPGVSIQQARADMEGVTQALAKTYPDADAGTGATLTPMKESMVGGVRTFLLLLLGAVGIVLLIACVNVANLLLARGAARNREMALRAALGAGTGRLVRQMLTESILLAAAGGGLGLLLANLGTGAALAALPATLPRAGEVGMDARVLWFTIALSLCAGILFGLMPALRAARGISYEALKEGGRGATGSRHHAQNALIALQMAMALVLLAGAGLVIRSLASLWNVNPGFNPDNVITFNLALPPQSMQASAAAIRATLRNFDAGIAATPGVEAESLTWGALPMYTEDDDSFWIEGQTRPASENEMDHMLDYIVGPGYLRTMRVPLLAGRFISPQDDEHSKAVVVIDEVLARKYFPNGDAVGKMIYQGDPTHTFPFEIIGIVGHVKQWGLDTDDKNSLRAQAYFSFMQLGDNVMKVVPSNTGVVVRSTGDISGFVDTIRRASKQINPGEVATGFESMHQVIQESLASRRFAMMLLGTFAFLALLLATMGIYGVISYSVTQRTHEIGIRLALGAQRDDILRLVLGQGAKLALIGIALGLAASAALTRLMSNLLFGVSATDPLTFTAVALLLAIVALAACYIPARRAMRVDPMVALRYE
jgi:putative ABC transport system permease protein